MSPPRVVSVAPGSPGDVAGIVEGDVILAVDGVAPRDILEYRQLVDEADPVLTVVSGGLEGEVEISKAPGAPLGVEVHSPVFDEITTCDNHCEFCFIHQLPPGMRESLSLKDDDYRLSFLYGNFTTLTRFTEADLERVLDEGLSPLHVSIHAIDPDVRIEMLRNRRGAPSLRWLRVLLDHGVEVHGQVVVCPDRNDGEILEDTLCGILDEYPELASVCVVPLGVSDHNREAAMRPHTRDEAADVLDRVHRWQNVALSALGRRLVFAADECYLLAGQDFPPPEAYEGFGMHEDGIGMGRSFELEFAGEVAEPAGVRPGFFSWVDGAPADGYRAPRLAPSTAGQVTLRPRASAPIGILTGPLGAEILGQVLGSEGLLDGPRVRLIPVANEFFGGNIGVTGLMVGADLIRTLAAEPEGHRYLLPDVCLSEGRFLDGLIPADLPRSVEIVPTDGLALRRLLDEAGVAPAPLRISS